MKSYRRALFPVLKPICAAALVTLTGAAQAGLVISQVYGGGGASSGSPSFNRDYVEIFNAGNAAVNLAGLSVQYGATTGSFNAAVSLAGGSLTQLLPGQYLLVGLGGGSSFAGATLNPAADVEGGINASATNGKFALVQGTSALACGASSATCSTSQLAQIIDLVGYGTANQAEGTAVAALSSTTAAVRNAQGCTDSGSNIADFSVAAPAPRNSLSALSPCGSAPAPSPSPSPSPAPAPAPTPAPAVTPIPTIQGDGHTSTRVGQIVTTSGVVTKRNSNGFFIQDPAGDNNPATSDGLFVFGTGFTPNVGDLVSVTGTVTEFNTGAATNARTLKRTVTQLSSVTSVASQGAGPVIAPTTLAFPATEDQLEALEGMLVQVPETLTASQNYFLGRYGQITLSAGGRLVKPTNIHPAGSADALALTAANASRMLVLDDGSSAQNPTPMPFIGEDNTQRAGDTVTGLTGVIDFGLSTASSAGLAAYKLHPTEAVNFTRAHPRTAAPEAVGGNLKVASFNVLNYFTTFTNGSNVDGATGQGCTLGTSTAASNCRGASNITEFNRQRTKIVKALAAIDADVVGLMEMQNNGNTAVQNLVAALNTELGSNRYASVALPVAFDPTLGGSAAGTDAIRVAMIYKTTSLSLDGAAVADTHSVHNRPPLAQTFRLANGERFSVVVNHFKSKGSCPAAGDADAAGNTDAGDGQGCWNALRTQQAQRLQAFVAGLQADRQDDDVLVIGDLNAYGKEDPILSFLNAGYTDLIERFHGQGGYSYVFDGEAGYLDHALATPTAAAKATGTTHWHINADEPFVIDYDMDFKRSPVTGACYSSTATSCSPDLYTATPYRSSDHDPIVLGLDLSKSIVGTRAADTLVGTAGDDVIWGGEGSDALTTGAGRDVIVFKSAREGIDTVTDFAPGTDRIDVRTLAAELRAASGSANLFASGHLVLVDTTAGVQLRVDGDGFSGRAVARPLVTLRGVSASQIDVARDLLQ